MTRDLFTKIHSQKKKKINISLDAEIKAELVAQKSIDGISISEKIEDLYRSHKKLVKGIITPDYQRSRGERGKPMFGDRIRKPIGIYLTPDAIAFFDEQAKKQKSDRSKIIELTLMTLLKAP